VLDKGYSAKLYLSNAAGEDLGTIFALSKRNIETLDPDRDDIDLYLFVRTTDEWVVSIAPLKTAYPPNTLNKTGKQPWDEELHNAMEFGVYRSLQLLASQFTRGQ